MATQCKFWLPKKKRFCANAPLRDSLFCGNHTERVDGQWIPCPIDPSHSVLEENLESHIKRCPLLKQVQFLSLQPFYQKGINSGKEEEDQEEDKDQIPVGIKDSSCTSEMKRKAVNAMTFLELSNLIGKIKSAHASICNGIQDSFKLPQACGIWTNREVDRKLPFQEKHVLQQASIIGNLEEFGMLKNPNEISMDGNDGPAVVEFGAGRGYLTQVLADCYGIKKVVLVERKSYKLKADRSLRQRKSLALERLKIDIEDLNLNAVKSLQGVSYLAIGKHLCGPATDMTLRCCISEQRAEDIATHSNCSCNLTGVAVATCCHHLCQWKHYINKRYMISLGMSKEDFHAMSWFTSWAVDADHGSDLCSIGSASFQFSISEKAESAFSTDPCGLAEFTRNMKASDRAALGFMCKDIIDAGRLMWVKERGFDSWFVKYVPSSISPENHLLIARHLHK